MFKSYFPSGWFRKSGVATGSTASASEKEDVSSFTMPGRDSSHLYKVSMTENPEEFVDIEYQKLSYAEVAKMSKNKKQTSRVPLAVPKGHRVNSNQYEVLADDDVTESLYMTPEKFKINNYFFKNKVYKDADRTRKMRKKPKH